MERRLSEEQPETFEFTKENLARAQEIIAKYPEGRQQSAVMPLLDLAQRQHDNWLPEPAIRYVADMLGMTYIRALEVATFYTMFNLHPVGKHHVRVCTTTPCWLRGSDAVLSACKERLGIDMDETTADGTFTLGEVECLGACVNAPVVQIGDDYFEDVDPESVVSLIDDLAAGEWPEPGPQIERHASAPVGGATTLVKEEESDARG